MLSSARPGRRSPARAAANTSRSSWTIRASQPRSTPAWSKPRTAVVTTSSGPAATATRTSPQEAPPSAGLLHAHARRLQRTGNRDAGIVGFQVRHIPIGSRPPASAPLSPGKLLGGLPPARRKGSLSLDRDGFPGLPPRRSSAPCRPGDPPPPRSPLHLAPPGLADGQGCSAALRSNPSP